MRMTEPEQWPPAAQTMLAPAARNAHGCPERRILVTTVFVAIFLATRQR